MDNGASSYRRFLEGDDSGLVDIVRDYKDGLMLFINRYVQNIHLAEDLTEDTFFLLVTKKPRFTPRCTFKTWLYTIGRNVALNELKKRRRHDSHLQSDLTAWQQTLEQAYLQQEEQLRLYRALEGLRPEYGTALHLKYFEDLSNEQIARVMKRSKRQVENLLYQAKLALKRQLEQEGSLDEDL